MKATFLGQPFGPKRVGDWLKNNLANMSWDRFQAAVAFAKLSGTQHVADLIANFGSKREVTISVGIDHRATSQEALQALLDAIPSQGLYVCHHKGAYTYHPKLYLFANDATATVVIGSNNLTEGGLYTNYEVSLAVDLNLSDHDDKQLYSDIRAALASWTDSSSNIVECLDDSLLQKLVKAGLVATEIEIASEQSQKAMAGKNLISKSLIVPFFGSPAIPPAPPLPPAGPVISTKGPIGGGPPPP